MKTLTDRARLARKSAWTVCQAGAARDVAAALGVHPSQPSRWRNGAETGIAYRAHRYVADLARSPSTDPVPFVMSLMVEALKQELSKRSTRELVREWWCCFDREPLEEAAEEIAGRGADWDAFCAAHLKEAATQERLVAITEVLVHDRNVNPRHFRGDGVYLGRQP